MRLKHYLSCMLILLSFITVNAQEKKELKEGDQAPTFKYLDINGKEVSLSDLEGKYVYIDVWATWCGPCQYELPHLKELEKKMHGKKIVFVSISCDKEQGLGGVQLHNGGDREFMTAFGIRGIPRFILLDKKGKIVNPNMTRPSNPETEKTLKALKGI